MPFTQSTPVTLSPPSVTKDSNTLYRTWGTEKQTRHEVRPRSSLTPPCLGPQALSPKQPSTLEPEKHWLKEHHGAMMVTRRKARGEPAGALGGRTFWQEPAAAGANLALSYHQENKGRWPQASPTASNSQFHFPRQTQSSIFSDFAVMLPPDVESHPWHLFVLTFKPHPTRQEKHPETLS